MTNVLTEVGKSLHLIEDDGSEEPKKDGKVLPSAPVAAAAASVIQLTGVYPAVPLQNSVYTALVTKTQFSTCPNLQKYLQMCKTLEAPIADPTTRQKAALLACGISLDVIVAEIKGLRDILSGEENRAGQKFNEQEQNTVVQSQNAAAALEQEIVNKQAQLASIKSGIDAAASRVTINRTQFAGALAARKSDIDQLENEIRSLGGSNVAHSSNT